MATEPDRRPDQAPGAGTSEDEAAAATGPAEQREGPDAGTPEHKAVPGAGTPEGDKLRSALRAFDGGDYRAVRALARELAQAEDPEVVQMAQDLSRRVAVDPVLVAVLLACAALWLVVTYIYVIR